MTNRKDLTITISPVSDLPGLNVYEVSASEPDSRLTFRAHLDALTWHVATLVENFAKAESEVEA